jgi:hypothetical protein
MPENKNYAVVTGDIIDSSSIEGKDQLNNELKKSFKLIEKKFKSKTFTPSFNIFRGDSFQGVLANPENALRVGLLIRTTLKKSRDGDENLNWDTRISIGVGKVDYLPENISEGDGAAYRNSGPVLDKLKGNFKLAITTPSDTINQELETSCALADAVMNKWTPAQAEIVYRLLQNTTQKEIGEALDISEAAVHYRVKAAGWFAIKKFLQRFESLINQ